MKILVIGGAGYIGSHVSWEFLKKGHKVHIYDKKIEKVQGDLKKNSKLIKGDLLDYSFLKETLSRENYDGVIHLAAYKAVGESMQYPEKYSYNNLSGTITLINALKSTKTQNLVFSSSAAIYGNPQYLPLDENHPKNPENYYGYTKLAIEEILNWHSRLTSLRYVALRYFNAAGYDEEGHIQTLEKNPANLIPAIMEAACGMRKEVLLFGNDYPTRDGTAIRDYIHVTDLAKAHVKSLEYLISEKKNISLNLGTEKGLSVKEIFDKTQKIVGKEIPHKIVERRLGDPTEIYASSQLAFKTLEWKPNHSDLETLIKSTWNVYKNYKN